MPLSNASASNPATLHYIGLTGGMGSGKSTVAKILLSLGGFLIDADAVSRQLTQQPPPHPTPPDPTQLQQTPYNAKPYTGGALKRLLEAFGQGVFESTPEADLKLNRSALRALILQDTGAKLQLEAILHPLIQEAMAFERQTFVRMASGLNEGDSVAPVFCVYDVPLLVEGLARKPSAPWRALINELWVVDCGPETQVQRVLARTGAAPGAWTADEAKRAIAAQASRAQRRSVADVVIYNDNISLENLHAQVRSALSSASLLS